LLWWGLIVPLFPAYYSPSVLQEPGPCGEGLRAGGDAPTNQTAFPSQAALPQTKQYSQTKPISHKPDRTRAGKTDEAYAAEAPCSARFGRNMSTISITAPTVIALSAILNAGKYQLCCQCTRMKSTTWPCTMRSYRLPRAPPRIKARATDSSHLLRGRRASQTSSRPLTPTAMAMKNQRGQPPASDRKLNAAPVLEARVKLNRPSITGTCWYRSRLDSATHLLSRSSAMTATLSRSHTSPLRRRSGMLAHLAGAFD